MPVLERGTGLDRSFHKLPVLLVDDFAMITPDLLRQVRRGCTGEQTEKKRETVGATVAVYAVALRSIVSDNHTFARHISKTDMPNLNARFVPTS